VIPAASATSVRAETPAAVPASPAPDQAVSAGQPVRTLDAESIKLLMQQGEQFVASGDLVAARLVYRRAAESGNAAAALALGATFDPIVLAKIGVRGVGADVEKARSWYERAKEFGSPDAPRRLEMLANR
jgi:TPR repeat protein